MPVGPTGQSAARRIGATDSTLRPSLPTPIVDPDLHADARAFVLEALVDLADGCDPAAVGAAVTVALCGHWEHEGACRWPHNNALDAGSAPARFRTLFVAEPGDEALVRRRIESALRDAGGWRVVSVSSRSVAAAERALAQRLLRAPRAAG